MESLQGERTVFYAHLYKKAEQASSADQAFSIARCNSYHALSPAVHPSMQYFFCHVFAYAITANSVCLHLLVPPLTQHCLSGASCLQQITKVLQQASPTVENHNCAEAGKIIRFIHGKSIVVFLCSASLKRVVGDLFPNVT